MGNFSDIMRFYLEDYDFQTFVNKNIQTYNKTLDYMLHTPTTIEYYKSLQKGGCNAKPEDGRSNN